MRTVGAAINANTYHFDVGESSTSSAGDAGVCGTASVGSGGATTVTDSGYRGSHFEPFEVVRGSGLSDEVDDSVDTERFAVAVPPPRFALVARAEDDLGAVWQGHFNLDDRILSARGTYEFAYRCLLHVTSRHSVAAQRPCW